MKQASKCLFILVFSIGFVFGGVVSPPATGVAIASQDQSQQNYYRAYYRLIRFLFKKRIEICHIPRRNPENYRTIKVSVFSKYRFLKRGAFLGPCDPDQDGVLQNIDNCPEVANPGQVDENQNGVGDACESCEDLNTCASCDDNELNGNETDVDCVGSDCPPCDFDQDCNEDADCGDAAQCQNGTCTIVCNEPTANCDGDSTNGCEVNLHEDVDNCGDCNSPCEDPGPNQVASCNLGQCAVACAEGFSDCDDDPTNGCEVEGACPVCTDNVQNGLETDIDCGGPDCPKCELDAGCEVGSDCTTNTCENNVCVLICEGSLEDCDEDVANGCEVNLNTDLNNCGACGTACPEAGPNQIATCSEGECSLACEVGFSDCDQNPANGCEVAGECANCNDNTKNADETDVDCGGPDCPKCDTNEACIAETDCVSGICTNGVCLDSDCSDQIKNGAESDVDCGGDACGPCDIGEACDENADCSSLACDTGVCVASCTNNQLDGDETDIDCGGGTCPTCPDGDECEVNADCSSDLCSDGVCTNIFQPICGNGFCEVGESSLNCPLDCNSGGGFCGDGQCTLGESQIICPQDCGSPAQCGNGICETGETVFSCPQDCSVCGDGFCAEDESPATCEIDCGDGSGCTPGAPLCTL